MKNFLNYLFILFLFLFNNFAIACDKLEHKISHVIENFASNHKIESVYAIADKDWNIVVNGAQGFYDLKTNQKLRVDQQMAIASGTKPFAAAAILILQDRGLLNVKDTIAKYLTLKSGIWHEDKMPKWAHQVTIHQLLTHSAGIPEYVFTYKLKQHHTHDEVNRDILHFIAHHELEFKPGSQFKYTNTGYMILGMIIEQVTGKKFADFVKEAIFDPSGMTQSRIAEYGEAIDFQLGKATHIPTRYYLIPSEKGLQYHPVGDEIVVAPNADSGGISTVEDLIKWNKALHGGKLLSKKSYKLMTKKYFVSGNSGGYPSHIGYGLYISQMPNGEEIYHHEGRALGIRSDNGYLPKRQVSYAMISNVMLYVPEQMKQALDLTKPENQVDILFLRNKILESL